MLIGRLIPAGTGMDCYRNIGVERTSPMESPLFDLDFSELDLEEAGKTIRMDDDEDAADDFDTRDEDLMDDEDAVDFEDEEGSPPRLLPCSR